MDTTSTLGYRYQLGRRGIRKRTAEHLLPSPYIRFGLETMCNLVQWYGLKITD